MSKSDHIAILDPDPASRAALETYLSNHGFDQGIKVLDSKGYKKKEGIVLSVECGGDNLLKLPDSDIFSKPLRLGKLISRLNYHVRQMRDQNLPDELSFGPHKLDWHNHVILNGKTEIKMTEKETEILKLLFEQDGKPITREELLDQVWGYAEGVETHTLETHIYRLRQKIEKDAATPKLLVTTDDGYILNRKN